jgi:hypothetical protein
LTGNRPVAMGHGAAPSQQFSLTPLNGCVNFTANPLGPILRFPFIEMTHLS